MLNLRYFCRFEINKHWTNYGQSNVLPKTSTFHHSDSLCFAKVLCRAIDFNCVGSFNLWYNEIITLSNMKSEKVIDLKNNITVSPDNILVNYFIFADIQIVIFCNFPKTVKRTNQPSIFLYLGVFWYKWAIQYKIYIDIHCPNGFWSIDNIWFSAFHSYRMQKRPRTSC